MNAGESAHHSAEGATVGLLAGTTARLEGHRRPQLAARPTSRDPFIAATDDGIVVSWAWVYILDLKLLKAL